MKGGHEGNKIIKSEKFHIGQYLQCLEDEKNFIFLLNMEQQ